MIDIPTRDQTLALAAVFQACHFVDRLATTGEVPPSDLNAAMVSLLEQNPTSTEALFGGLRQLEPGLRAMDGALAARKQLADNPVVRYVLGALLLERRLLRKRSVMAQVTAGITQAARQAEHFAPTHDNVLANVADLYQRTISTFNYRIQVQGREGYLQQPTVACRVRCLLFAAIRAGVHWHHLGGRPWQVLVLQSRLLKQVRALRAELAATAPQRANLH